jgi:methylmalonyl-CoA/ethylmalonyl-CoA epimerase
MEPLFKNILQAGFIVEDVFEPLKIFSGIFGIGPWSIYEFNADVIKNMIVKGHTKDFKALVAICKLGNFGLEFIKPLDGTSIYSDFLKTHGEGFQHIAYHVDDYFDALTFFKENKLQIYQSGSWLDRHIFTYFDTSHKLKHISEIYRRDPSFSKYETTKSGVVRRIFPVPECTYPPENEINDMPEPAFKKVKEIGIVVRDINKTAATFQNEFGIGPWIFFELTSSLVKNMEVYNIKKNYRALTAKCRIGDIAIELIQPEDDCSIYADFLKSMGEGPYYIGYEASHYEKLLIYLRSKNFKMIQSGEIPGKYWFSYFDTRKELKHILKVYKIFHEE